MWQSLAQVARERRMPSALYTCSWHGGAGARLNSAPVSSATGTVKIWAARGKIGGGRMHLPRRAAHGWSHLPGLDRGLEREEGQPAAMSWQETA